MAYRQVTVGAAEVSIVDFNARRTALAIKNIGAARVFIDQDRGQVTAKGMYLDPGEAMTLALVDKEDPRTQQFASTLAATADLRIHEGFEP